MKFTGTADELLELSILDTESSLFSTSEDTSLSVLWFQEDGNELTIDGEHREFCKNQILFLTEFHRVTIIKKKTINFLRFNKSFYCVIDNDTEVSCKGVLFYGSTGLPVIQIPDEEIEHFQTLWKMFSLEMQAADYLQIEMLQMMLRRYLILCTRLYKKQASFPAENQESDIIREFNYLVEQHFKTKHTVAEYAELLYKSPKTLSNLFAKMGSKSPLQYIQERKIIEARRMLLYTNDPVKEVAYELGFNDIQAFSRFFKKHEGISPTEFKEKAPKQA